VLNIVRTVATVAINLTDSDWNPGARRVPGAQRNHVGNLGAVPGARPRAAAGRLWAWITTILLLSVTLLFGGIVLLGELASGDAPLIGLAMVVPALAMLLALTVSRAAREFLARPRSSGLPTMPAQPGVMAR
jgi:hypothetical protein